MPLQRKKNGKAAEVHSKEYHETVSYQEKDFSGHEFNDCRFHKCNFYGAKFEGTIFHDCVFDGCDLSLVKIKQCSFVNVDILNSKAIGILWNETVNLFNLKFSQSILDYSSFYGKALKKPIFTNCHAHEVDFTFCSLVEADFAGADLLNAVFRSCDISKANFVDARNYDINLGINTAKQARFNLPEALSLFGSFDVVIEG